LAFAKENGFDDAAIAEYADYIALAVRRGK
jgi:hypothetical protein